MSQSEIAPGQQTTKHVQVGKEQRAADFIWPAQRSSELVAQVNRLHVTKKVQRAIVEVLPGLVLTIDTPPQHSPFAAPGTTPTGVGGYS